MGKLCYGIDIGTNSARLMLAEEQNGTIRSRYKLLRTVRTGEGVHTAHRLSPEAIGRTVAALKEFRGHMDGEHPDIPVFCFATSAVRDSSNAEELLMAAKREAKINIRILSGTEEAEIGFLGAIPGGNGGIIDIGGGSTEFVLGQDGRLAYRKSFNAGTIRCREIFGSEGDGRGVAETIRWAEELFAELEVLRGNIFTGIGGTITTVSAMIRQLETYSSEKIQGSKVTREEIEELLREITPMTPEQRRTLPGLQPQRADIIPYGMAVLVGAMRTIGLAEIFVSDADNLEGYAIKYKNAIFP